MFQSSCFWFKLCVCEGGRGGGSQQRFCAERKGESKQGEIAPSPGAGPCRQSSPGPESGRRAAASARRSCFRRTTTMRSSVVASGGAGSAGLSCARSPRSAACCAQTPPGSSLGRCSARAAYRPRPAQAVPARTIEPAGCSWAKDRRPGRS